MNIGDKVRLLHGMEEGVITKLSPGGQVEIEIEDGFRIPVLKSEVVVINEAEEKYFNRGGIQESRETETTPVRGKVHRKEGVFLTYVPYNDQQHGMILINDTSKDLLYSVSEIFGINSKTLDAGVIMSKSYKKMEEKSIKNFEEWPPLHFLLVPVNKSLDKHPKPFERKINFKASSFFKSKGKAPLLEKEGYLFQLDDQIKDLDIMGLNRILNPKDDGNDPRQAVKRPPATIDLHIEKLSKDHDLMSNGEKLKLQLEIFEKNLNAALISGMDEITFIHGIGNGVLRKEIHRILSQLKGIKYFKDHHKTNFGYGSTLVKIHE
ncbi:MAG: Smr/MutS family protein [Cyclobacteriaceae bacterium]